MMQIVDDEPRRGGDTLLPMINVVFLLLIFFLISAEMTPPAPMEVESPEAILAEEANGTFTLFVDAQGALAYRDVLGAEEAGRAEVLAALRAAREAYCGTDDCEARPPELLVRADAGLAVPDLARLIGALSIAGFVDVALVTRSADAVAPNEGGI
ncbi:ExbD/TolR family protein [Albirhodobacter sp. R86504]|uniref:ExbD/TolR family protein n=1 Tax=Albirhodobacter sp. R86504 TaxID=3093848 RepID=UPI00366CFF4A